jgi:hypothetical protein
MRTWRILVAVMAVLLALAVFWLLYTPPTLGTPHRVPTANWRIVNRYAGCGSGHGPVLEQKWAYRWSYSWAR